MILAKEQRFDVTVMPDSDSASIIIPQTSKEGKLDIFIDSHSENTTIIELKALLHTSLRWNNYHHTANISSIDLLAIASFFNEDNDSSVAGMLRAIAYFGMKVDGFWEMFTKKANELSFLETSNHASIDELVNKSYSFSRLGETKDVAQYFSFIKKVLEEENQGGEAINLIRKEFASISAEHYVAPDVTFVIEAKPETQEEKAPQSENVSVDTVARRALTKTFAFEFLSKELMRDVLEDEVLLPNSDGARATLNAPGAKRTGNDEIFADDEDFNAPIPVDDEDMEDEEYRPDDMATIGDLEEECDEEYEEEEDPGFGGDEDD